MPRTRSWAFAVLALLSFAGVSLAQPATQSKSHPPRHHRKAAVKPLVLPPLPSGPLPQLPMDLIPATPPKVGFQDGLLTIVSQNSTLGDILREVQKLTGASVDIPPNANERVVTRLGPGGPRDVLASLLDGSSFNYVMVGSNSDPEAVTSLILTPKLPGSSMPGQAVANVYQPNQGYVPPPAPRPFIAQQPPPGGAQVSTGEENANEQDASADENADQDQGQADPNGAAQQGPAQPAQPPNVGPKTPEQILEMIRRQQQQPPTAVPPNPQ